MKVKLLMLLLILFVVAGCFTYEETIVINKDGSGVMLVHYYGSRKNNIDSDGLSLYLGSKREIKYKIMDDYTTKKVRLTDFYIRDRGSYRHVYFTIEFPDFDELNKTYRFRRNKIAFRRSNGLYYFRRNFEVEGDSDFAYSESEFEEAVKSALKKTILDRIKFIFEVEMPHQIIDSNSNRIKLKRVSLWKYTLGDLLEKEYVTMWVKGR